MASRVSTRGQSLVTLASTQAHGQSWRIRRVSAGADTGLADLAQGYAASSGTMADASRRQSTLCVAGVESSNILRHHTRGRASGSLALPAAEDGCAGYAADGHAASSRGTTDTQRERRHGSTCSGSMLRRPSLGDLLANASDSTTAITRPRSARERSGLDDAKDSLGVSDRRLQ